MQQSEYYDAEEGRPKDEELVAVRYDPNETSKESPKPSTSAPLPKPGVDPGLAVLLQSHDPLNNVGVRLFLPDESPTDQHHQSGIRMTDPPEIESGNGSTECVVAQTSHDSIAPVAASSAVASPGEAFVGTASDDDGPRDGQEANMRSQHGGRDLVMRARVDSGQDSTLRHPDTAKVSRLPSPLKVQTDSDVKRPRIHDYEDSIATSPTLSKHTKTAAEGTGDDLAPYGPTSPSATSPERLPSIRQLTGPIATPTATTASLTELAEAAMATQDPRPRQTYTHQHRTSFGSAPPQSPSMAYPPSMHPSPQAYYAPNLPLRSPASTISDHYNSPSTYHPSYSPYAHRRGSEYHVAQMPPSLPSASSSGDSYGTVSSIDGYSTSHTTPLDSGDSDCTIRPHAMLPPPPGMSMQMMLPVPGPYKCDVSDCNAQPFQTPYLLSSHKNVHSQSRPHYCPVPSCSRSEGGKGFKRKNEMIRHGLVHSSPGYRCPFCPDREHMYPRPDNLQRHVRVHHTEKDKGDPVLREVLAKKVEGMGKGRRRRGGDGAVA